MIDAISTRLVASIAKAHCSAQAKNPSAGPWDLEGPSDILLLADEVVAGSERGQRQERVSALFFRGVLHIDMCDFHAAAADFRAAYVASDGHQPWILKNAGWTAASATDGVPLGVMLQNYKDGQVMYEMLLHYFDEDERSTPECPDLESILVFCLWELAQVLLWQQGWMNPTTAPRMAVALGNVLPPGQCDEHAAKALMERVHELKERALKAESMMAGAGIMNSLARDAVMGRCALLGRGADQKFAKQAPVTPKSGTSQCGRSPPQQSVPRGAEAASAMPSAKGQDAPAAEVSSQLDALSAFCDMQNKEVSRMKEEQQALSNGDLMSFFAGLQADQARNAAANERGMQERRKALEARVEALAAREAAFRRREAEQAEQRARWQREAERLPI